MIARLRSLLLGATMVAALGACSEEATMPEPVELELPEYAYWRPAADDGAARPWAVILPGGGGMEVFGDTEHYFRWAEWLNDRGIDVLLLHYQAANEDFPAADGERPDQQQARIAGEMVSRLRNEGRMDEACPGVVLGWSFGGAGTLELAAGGAEELPGLAGAVGFYPLVTFQPDGYAPQVPVLVLQGDVDDTTTPEALANLVDNAAGQTITVELYAAGEHAFDVAGLTEPVEWNSGTFLYNADAAEAATQRLDQQLVDWDMTDGAASCAR